MANVTSSYHGRSCILRARRNEIEAVESIAFDSIYRIPRLVE